MILPEVADTDDLDASTLAAAQKIDNYSEISCFGVARLQVENDEKARLAKLGGSRCALQCLQLETRAVSCNRSREIWNPSLCADLRGYHSTIPALVQPNQALASPQAAEGWRWRRTGFMSAPLPSAKVRNT
jgi:hypothetical protein